MSDQHKILGLRVIYLYPWKNYEKDFAEQSLEQLQDYVYQRLETIVRRERIWIVFIAGVGFFADAYAIFAINLVIPMLEIVYWQGAMPQKVQIGITIATLSGSMFGQLFFGIAADWLGRRRMYGWELIVTIVATIGVASASSGISGIVAPIGTYNVIGTYLSNGTYLPNGANASNGTYPSDGNYNMTGNFFVASTYTANGIDPWNGSLPIIFVLVAWRFVLGLAIGADYPLSAVICSEFAPKKHRARMLSAVFFFQPLGQLAATLVGLVVTAGYKDTLSQYDQMHCYQHPNCLKTVDIMWRIIIGLGAVLPAVALGFRLAILESPRYTVDVRKKGAKAAAQLGAMVVETDDSSSDEASIESNKNESRKQQPASGVLGNGARVEETRVELSALGDDQIRPVSANGQHEIASSNGHVRRRVASYGDNGEVKPDVVVSAEEETPSQEKSVRADIRKYFMEQGHGWTLFATSLCWFCVDLPFYGLGMNSTSIISQIWNDKYPAETNLYSLLFKNTWESLIFVSLGAIMGGIITFFSINRLGEKTIQVIGFSALFILFIFTGGLLNDLMNTQQDHFIIFLYVMCQTFFNFGPNTTTYILPAEFFPTRYRASAHGISAASGKLGSVIAQAIIYGISVNKAPIGNDIQDWLGWTLLGFSPLMLVGLFATIFLIPSTRGADGKPLSLETLAAENGRPNNRLEKIWKRKPKADIVVNGIQDEENRGQVINHITPEQKGPVSGQPSGGGGYEMDNFASLRDVEDAINRIE